MERVQNQFWVVRSHHRLQRDKLSKDRVVSGIFPIDTAQDIGSSDLLVIVTAPPLNWGNFTYVILMAMVASDTPAKISARKS